MDASVAPVGKHWKRASCHWHVMLSDDVDWHALGEFESPQARARQNGTTELSRASQAQRWRGHAAEDG